MRALETSSPVVLISGCSSGFGLHSAVYLASHGMTVVPTMRDLARRDPLDRAAARAGFRFQIEQLDVDDEGSIRRCVSATLERLGRIDGLVNNAGYGLGGFVHDLSMDEIKQQMQTNLLGVFALTKAVLPHMIARRAGRIVNLSSTAGRWGVPTLSAYCASKFAVEGISESLRYELLPFGVQVCMVEPGSFRTEMFGRNGRKGAGVDAPDSPYAALSRRVQERLSHMMASFPTDVTPVCRAIHKALVSPDPPFRQRVGVDARLQALARLAMPQRVVDRLFGGFLR